MKTPNVQLPTPKGVGLFVAFAIFATFVVSGGAAAPSPVADAAQRGDKAAVRALIAKKADVNAPQNDGGTAIHWAAFRGDVELAEIVGVLWRDQGRQQRRQHDDDHARERRHRDGAFREFPPDAQEARLGAGGNRRGFGGQRDFGDGAHALAASRTRGSRIE